MISNIKRNKIDLYKLKNIQDLIYVEKLFDIFLKKILNSRKKKLKYFFKNNKCACGSKKILDKFKIGLFTYNKCKCGTYFIDPMIKSNMLDLIYSEKGPYSKYRKKFLENKAKKKIRNEIINRKVNQLLSLSLNKSSHILDFGCGDGSFLKACKKKGFKNLVGVDNRFVTSTQNDGILKTNTLNKIENSKQFNCITLWGVLEHLNDPLKFCKYLLKFLKKGGFILLEVPNADSILMKYLSINPSKQNRYIEPGRHLFFFSKKFFNLISKKFRLKLIDYETNGLDFQTLLGPQNYKISKQILIIQNIIDKMDISDHLRVVLQKK